MHIPVKTISLFVVFLYFPFWRYCLHSISKKIVKSQVFGLKGSEHMTFKEILENNKSSFGYVFAILFFLVFPPYVLFMNSRAFLGNIDDLTFVFGLSNFGFVLAVAVGYYRYILK